MTVLRGDIPSWARRNAGYNGFLIAEYHGYGAIDPDDESSGNGYGDYGFAEILGGGINPTCDFVTGDGWSDENVKDLSLVDPLLSLALKVVT